LLDAKVDVTPKEDGQIDPAQLLKATYDSGVTAAEMDMTACGTIVKDSSGSLALQVEPNRSFAFISNELSKGLEFLVRTQAMVTLRGRLYKKSEGKKKANPSAPLKLQVLESAEEGIEAEKTSVISEHRRGWARRMQSAFGEPARPKEDVIAAGEIGSRLPDFSVEDLQRHKISSDDLRGKVVLIDVWATWCLPCKKEMPGYQKLLGHYGDRGFAVVGFKLDTMMDAEDPLVFAKKIGVRYPLAVAADDLKQKLGGIEGIPTAMLYDRRGVLRNKVIGFEYTDVIESTLKPLL
jgi:thiol-disulfide isomerase/thioredoxin